MNHTAPENAAVGKCLRGAGFITIVALAALSGWIWGAKSPPTNPSMLPTAKNLRVFQISGSSMVPALTGNRLHVRCDTCQSERIVSTAFQQQPASKCLCSICGGTLLAADLESEPFREGDVVQLEPVGLQSVNQLAVGDIVAVMRDGKLRAKRIAGGPGDVIGLDGSRIMVNGTRVEDAISQRRPRCESWTPALVDQDSRQATSRWSTESNRWSRDRETRAWRYKPRTGRTGQSEQDWLVYNHLSIHDHNKPSPIYDDYQFNVGVTRPLNEVDRLSVSVQCSSQTEVRMRIAIWASDAKHICIAKVGGHSAVQTRWCDGEPATDLPVSKTSPIAISANGNCVIDQIKIERFIEYRLGKADLLSDAPTRYPIHLRSNEWYVLGDNVPVSVDSRQWGPIQSKDIHGVIHR